MITLQPDTICNTANRQVQHSGESFVNRTNLVHKFSLFSLHVSGNYVPIIRRKYRTNATPGISHSIDDSGMRGGVFYIE